MNLRNNTFSITTRQIGQIFKNIIGQTQIAGGAKSHFWELIIKILNISI